MMQHSEATQSERIIVKVDAEIEDIIPIFFETLHEEIETGLESLQEGDYETIRNWGHTLKGAGMGYGFETISEIGQSLEQATKARDAEEVRKLVDQLSAYLKRVEVVFEQIPSC